MAYSFDAMDSLAKVRVHSSTLGQFTFQNFLWVWRVAMAGNPIPSRSGAPNPAWFAGTLNAATAAARSLQQLFRFFSVHCSAPVECSSAQGVHCFR